MLIYKHNTTPISINIGDEVVRSKKKYNVLGVVFNSKLQCSDYMLTVINKVSRAFNANKLKKNYFKTTELLQLHNK
jgi:hypothetical protein